MKEYLLKKQCKNFYDRILVDAEFMFKYKSPAVLSDWELIEISKKWWYPQYGEPEFVYTNIVPIVKR